MISEKKYQSEVSKLLYQLGQKGLKASDEFILEGTEFAQNVFLTLQKHSKNFPVAEARYAGSFGKKTEVIYPDLDLVVVVNNCKPPYEKVLDEFEDILLLNQRKLKIRENSIVKNKNSLQFVFVNGIEVDLLPAANLEHRQVYEIIAKNPDDYYNYSSCLVAKQLAFMTSHPSSFLHCVIRLVKYWFKSLLFKDKPVYGGSTIMELIGVAVAEMEEDKFDDPDIVRAFNRAMEWISSLNTLKLAFVQTSEGKWKQVQPGKLSMMNRVEVVPGVVGTPEILKKNFFIIEPANPYNDLLEGKDRLVIERLMEFAKVTRGRMTKLMNMNGGYATYNPTTNVIGIDIMRLFEQQPAKILNEFPSGATKDILLGCSYTVTSSLYDMKVRNEKVFKKPEVKLFLETMKWNLIRAVNSVTNGNRSTGQNGLSVRANGVSEDKKKGIQDVTEAVETLVETSMDVKLAPCTKRLEDYDVTLTIPYSFDDDVINAVKSVKCSFTWK